MISDKRKTNLGVDKQIPKKDNQTVKGPIFKSKVTLLKVSHITDSSDINFTKSCVFTSVVCI